MEAGNNNEKILQMLQEIKDATLIAVKPVLSMEEAAAFTGRKVSYLYKLTHERKIPYYKSGNGGAALSFKRKELEEWLTAVRVPTNDELEAQAAMRTATKGGVL